MTVVKRDGRKVEFDKQKIRLAVLQAFNEVDKEETSYAKEKSRDIANYIEEYAKKADKDLSVEEIQDMVEDKLMASNRKDVARSYVIYRNDRQREREKYKSLMKKSEKNFEQPMLQIKMLMWMKRVLEEEPERRQMC